MLGKLILEQESGAKLQDVRMRHCYPGHFPLLTSSKGPDFFNEDYFLDRKHIARVEDEKVQA